jgi:hypothetical protein
LRWQELKESITNHLECEDQEENLDQVPYSVYLNKRGKRSIATRYVVNLDYNASEQDLREAMDKIFQRIQVEKITIPRVNCWSMFGFIKLS